MLTDKLTGEVLSCSRVIARGNKIRDIERLVVQYGGQRKDWSKKSSPPLIDEHGNTIEIHWYERLGEKYELKLKYPGQ